MGTGRLKVAASVTLALGMLAAFGANYRIDEKGNVHSARTIAERVAIIAPVAPGVLRARPTFNSCGVCFGSVQAVEGLALEHQTKGDRQWKVCREFPHFDESGDYRGSLMYLREDTAYVCRSVVKGKEIARTSFRTWASDVPIARTVFLDERTSFPLKVSDKGSPTGWIRYAAKPGVVLDNRTKDSLSFVIDGAEYVVFDGLTVRGSGASHVFTLVNSREVRIRNCDISRWGRVGLPRFDMHGRLYDPAKEAKGYGINYDAAIKIGKGCSCVTVERCFVHDPRGRANSWYYSHPAGPEAVLLARPDHSTVIRYNDFIGSDIHRWNDAVESEGNFSEDGGFNRDADVYGNFMIYCNDDCIELDGGQQNVRCFDNRFEASFSGLSFQGCMVSPVYLVQNGFYSMCDEFGGGAQTLKSGGGAHGEEATAFISRNLLWGKGMGIIWMGLLRAYQKGNVFCGDQKIHHRECSPLSVSEGDRFGVEMDEKDLPTDLPVRPLDFTLDHARFSGIKVARGAASPQSVTVVAKGGKRAVAFSIAKCDVFDWFDVTPSAGRIPANGKLSLKVSFKPEKMKDRRHYRGAFVVRTPDGLSRPVSLYAETDFVPPYRAEKPGDFALYADGLSEGVFETFDREKGRTFSFDIPKDGRYYFMIHSKVRGRLTVAVDEDKPESSRQQNWDHPVWTMLTPGRDFGNMCRHYDLKAGRHTVTISAGVGAKVQYDGLVVTDNPLSFEPR